MAGILDSKTRIMDVIMTVEGRRQMAAGKFVPMFASFTDRHVFYERDLISGSSDASQYIYFEAESKPQDQIVIENDDSGLLVQYNGGNSVVSTDGKIYSASTTTIASETGGYTRTVFEAPTGSFASSFGLVQASIINSFKDQVFITTKYAYEQYNNFALNTDTYTFRYNNLSPFRSGQPKIEVSSLEPLFVDDRLSHIDNFQYLPPTYRSSEDSVEPLGVYVPLKPTTQLTYEQLISYLKGGDPEIPLKEKAVVDFSETSIQSNVFMQMFEGKVADDSASPVLKKLDCIDFGEFKDENDKVRPFKRVFFAGKVYINQYGSPAFVNLFTIVAE